MTRWFVLAPGPSMSKQVADQVRGANVCAVGNVGIRTNDLPALAPWAAALVANDRGWWKRHPEALLFSGRRFSANKIASVDLVTPTTFGTSSNSGVLALDVVRNLGATEIIMLGFDHHGTHFFGPYTNGCANTPDRRRREFEGQFRDWRAGNKRIRVVNCTPGTRLKAFDLGHLKDFIDAASGRGGAGSSDPQNEIAGTGGRAQGGEACPA